MPFKKFVLKASSKLNTLARITPFVELEKNYPEFTF